MPSHEASLQAAFDSRDLDQFVALLDERVVWRGLPVEQDADHQHDAVTDDRDPDDSHDDRPPMCVSRAEVRSVFEQFLSTGGTGNPVVLAEEGNTIVVDPQPDPPLPYPLHQAFTFRGDRVVLIQDYPDRASALADLAG